MQTKRQATKLRKAVVALGPHRSGTSVIARSLLTAGLDLGLHVLEPNSENPKGFFENAAIIEFNDRLLKHLGLCWDYIGTVDITQLPNFDFNSWHDKAANVLHSEFVRGGDIALKDPRFCLLAPFWDHVLHQQGFAPHYILVLRHPLESAASQMVRRSRNPAFHFIGSALSEGALLWATYLHSALQFLSYQSASIASYDNFVSQPERALQILTQRLSLNLDGDAVREFCDSFMDSRLRRHKADQSEASSPLLQVCSDVHASLQKLDATEPVPIEIITRLAKQLASQLNDGPSIKQDLQHIYVAARNSAVEGNLALAKTREELAKASRIIAHNEASLLNKAALLEQQIQRYANARAELIFTRLENERLAIGLSAARDKVAAPSTADPDLE